ncbi:MAG: CdvA-like protein [Pyrodictiaceae archaeon]
MQDAPLTINRIQGFIGETVYDPYGRVLGKLVSLESDVDGIVTAIAVEDEGHRIRFVEANSVKISSGKVIVLPEWKVMANQTLTAYITALKRIKSLEDMYSRNEIPSIVYRELKKKLDESLSKLKSKAKKLKEAIRHRMDELDDENLRIERAIANLKVSYFAGEISEKSYKLAIDALRRAKESNAKELDELRSVSKRLESIEGGVLEFKAPERKEEAEEKKEQAKGKPEIPTSTQPIPVKIITG